ncbi:phage portal protein family protein [Pseudoalteromonas sp. TAE80]|uniref:phage portal protein family protein n=1 Tax=Pseudoalteromonas sp. TAE80 TaxID=1938598 RepID=UPI00406CA6DC
MEDKDGHLFSELTKRRRGWLKYDWSVEPPRNATEQEEKDAAAIQEILEDATWLDDLLFDCSDAILKSFSCNELNWAFDNGEHIITGYEFRDQNLFQTHPDNRNQLMLRDNSYTGQALNPFGWCAHVHRSKSGYIHRTGLTSTVAWPYLFKNYSIRDLAEFLEIYGLPLRLGKYPNGRKSHFVTRRA